MDDRSTGLDEAVPLTALLGYLNFSEGKPDPRFQKQFNDAYAWLADHGAAEPCKDLHAALQAKLNALHKSGASAFQQITQADAVLRLAFSQVLAAYRRHHADLLYHRGDRELFQPFFLARVAEAVLAQGPPWNEDERIVAGARTQLNDYVGHRPAAILETRPRAEPYDHERVRPIPLYLRGAGVAWGRYRPLLEKALAILRNTDPGLLAEASFDPNLLDELALDPRAYDHGHPVHRRPNYIFGEWDPHHLDLQGRYRRFVVRDVTLEALLHRIETTRDLPQGELLEEAAAVLAGTILMAAGISGSSPAAHDSTTTLATLIPRVARYRDAFYAGLLDRLDGAHAQRLRQEAALTRQPFGGARQQLNQFLARHRAAQLQQRHLAHVFAAMGYAEASRRQAARIPAVSIRVQSELQIRLTLARGALEGGRSEEAVRLVPEIEDLLQRGIACGALPDPWNILGFQALFPLSAAQEDAVRDTRIDQLIDTMADLFGLYDRLLSDAAGRGDEVRLKQLTAGMRRQATWWDRFATVEVGEVRHVHGGELVASAVHVAGALAQWHARGAASADLPFWRAQQENFRTPQAFARVVDALLRIEDYRAAMALLITWLGQAEQVPLEQGEFSFHQLALRWMLGLTRPGAAPAGAPELAAKFLDFLEANAEDYWQVPRLELADARPDEPKEESLFGAAYEGVTYRDSAADDQEGSVAEGGPAPGEFPLTWEAERLEKRLAFLSTVARLWQIAAPQSAGTAQSTGWLAAARANQQRLLALVDAIAAYPIPAPTGSQDALIEYDRRRVLKEQLLNRAIDTCLDTFLAVSTLQGVLGEIGPTAAAPPWSHEASRLERALLQGDAVAARVVLPEFLTRFRGEPLLFKPLSAGGQPKQILRAQIAQHVLRALVATLPRVGLLRETYQVLRTARAMEEAKPPESRGVTQFNELFQTGFQALLEAVVSSESFDDGDLADTLAKIARPCLALWFEHSRTLRLSALEGLRTEQDWAELRGFVQRYGSDLFHARFMTLGNLRGILHHGAGAYLDYLRDNRDPLHPVRLIEELDDAIARERTVQLLELTLQAVVENYAEYKDYNSTTTQSDYGENLYMLLDFLGLKASYERHFWIIRPLVMVHEALVRAFQHEAARLWRGRLESQYRAAADEHLQKLAQLEQTHGMRLHTVRDWLEERFTRPLDLDRLCALVDPAMTEASAEHHPHFEQLEGELEPYAANPSGVGLDVPHWLQRLALEVQRVREKRASLALLAERWLHVPMRRLRREEILAQIEDWEKPLEPPAERPA